MHQKEEHKAEIETDVHQPPERILAQQSYLEKYIDNKDSEEGESYKKIFKKIRDSSLNWVEFELVLKKPLYPYFPGSSGRTGKAEPPDLDQGR
jgi:hypothetical protein